MSAYKLDLGYQYKSVMNRSNSLHGVEQQAANRGNANKDFGADLFNGLFQAKPELVAEQGLFTETLQAVQNSESFQKIKRQTQGSVNWSAIGAGILLDELTKVVDYSDEKPPEPPKGTGEGLGKSKGEKEESKDKGESQSEESEDNEDGEEEESEGNGGQSDSQEQPEDNEGDEEELDGDGGSDPDLDGESEDLDDEWELDEPEEEELEQTKEPIKVSAAIQDAVDKAADKMLELIGGLKAGTGGGLSTSDVPLVDGFTALAQNKDLVKLLQRIGRLKLSNTFLSALQVGGPEETYGVTYGNSLEHVMPQELAGLAGNDDEFMVWADKYNKRNLQQRQFKSNTKPGKGPMIVCLDISSSMGGARIRWAQTIAAAMYLLAVKEKRGYALVPFNGNAWSYEPLSQGKLDPTFLNRVVSLNASGGTSYERAWRNATDFLARTKRGPWSHADIVFITDGECGFDETKWLADKTKYGVRLFSFILEQSEESATADWTYELLASTYRVSVEYAQKNYSHMIGRPVSEYFRRLVNTSDATMFIPQLTEESVERSFSLVKNAKQRAGKMVGA